MASDMDVDWAAEESEDPPDAFEDDDEATADEEGGSPDGSSSRQRKRGRGGSVKGTVLSISGYPPRNCNQCCSKHVATVQQKNEVVKEFLLTARQGETLNVIIREFKGEKAGRSARYADHLLPIVYFDLVLTSTGPLRFQCSLIQAGNRLCVQHECDLGH